MPIWSTLRAAATRTRRPLADPASTRLLGATTRRRRRRGGAVLACLAVVSLLPPALPARAQQAAALQADDLAGLRLRTIGPAAMSGSSRPSCSEN